MYNLELCIGIVQEARLPIVTNEQILSRPYILIGKNKMRHIRGSNRANLPPGNRWNCDCIWKEPKRMSI